MSHGLDTGPAVAGCDPDMPKFLQPLERLMLRVNDVMVILGMLALTLASLVLTWSVFSRFQEEGLAPLADSSAAAPQ